MRVARQAESQREAPMENIYLREFEIFLVELIKWARKFINNVPDSALPAWVACRCVFSDALRFVCALSRKFSVSHFPIFTKPLKNSSESIIDWVGEQTLSLEILEMEWTTMKEFNRGLEMFLKEPSKLEWRRGFILRWISRALKRRNYWLVKRFIVNLLIMETIRSEANRAPDTEGKGFRLNF